AELKQKRLRRVIEDCVHRVDAERIDMAFANPIERVLDKIISHLVAVRAVEVQRRAPWRLVTLGEIAPAEIPKVISFRSEVVVNDVENDGETVLVTSVDQALQAVRAAVRVLRSERLHPVVAPVAAAGKLRDRHQLDGCDA